MHEGRISTQTQNCELCILTQTQVCKLRVSTQRRACEFRISDNRMKSASNETRVFIVIDSHYWGQLTTHKMLVLIPTVKDL